jgi:hypothetical protein
MKKRTAEKVISRSILGLAIYRKDTMRRALRRRPRFWTVEREAPPGMRQPHRRLRLEFGEAGAAPRLTIEYDEQALAAAEAKGA